MPDSYYIDQTNVMPDYDQLTTVYAGDKHLIELKVKSSTTIRYNFSFYFYKNLKKLVSHQKYIFFFLVGNI